MRIAGILAAAAVLSIAAGGAARADSRAWAAARAGLPAETKLVIGVDVTAAQKTQLFAAYYPKLHDAPEAAKVLDAIKDGCKLDPLAVIGSVVVASGDDNEDAVIYVALNGLDKARASTCLQTLARTDDKAAKVAIKHTGNITEVTKGSETVYFGWVGKDVVVVPQHSKDRAALTKWMGGKGALARSDLGKTLGKLNTATTVWGAANSTKELQPGLTAKGGYGTLNANNGMLAVDVHALLENAQQATSAATMANQQLDQAKNGGPLLPAELLALLKATSVTADKDEVRIKANVAEKDVMGAIAFAAQVGGGGP